MAEQVRKTVSFLEHLDCLTATAKGAGDVRKQPLPSQ